MDEQVKALILKKLAEKGLQEGRDVTADHLNAEMNDSESELEDAYMKHAIPIEQPKKQRFEDFFRKHKRIGEQIQEDEI